MKLPRTMFRQASADGRTRMPADRPGGRRSILRHQQTPQPKSIGTGHPLLNDRRDQGFQRQSGATQAQLGPVVRGGDRGFRGTKSEAS